MTISVRWNSDCAEAQALFPRCPRSTLLQSPDWGLAKQAAEGWTAHWGVAELDGAARALALVLTKRIGPFTIARLNRGPLWLDGVPPSAAEVAAVLSLLRRRWGWRRAGMLLAAPELVGDADNLALLAACGFHRRRAPAWVTGWLDLGRDPADLRKALNGKWRNALAKSERAGLDCDLLVGAEGLDWLLPLYRQMQRSRGFTGISEALLGQLAAHDPAQLLTVRVRVGQVPASAVLMLRHGAAATYAIGWNGPEGRSTNANYLALWQAVAALRDQGCRWLDLGGIDAVNTPGVAEFKSRMNGEPYGLAGEFWAL